MRFWEPVTDHELDMIHEAACLMLSQMGMRTRVQEIRDVLLDAGATAGGGECLRFPRELVERSIASAPESFTIYDRRGGSLKIGGDTHHHLAGGTMTEVLDFPGWTRRSATLEDVRNLTRMIDALDCIDIAIPMVEAQDAPHGMREILSCAVTLKNTTKFCLACPAEPRANVAFIQMAKALAAGDDLSQRPTICLLAATTPGYQIGSGPGRTLLLAAHEGLPVVLMGGAIQGAQAPSTMAGSLVMKLAEQLAALCVVQTIRPGSPCLMDWGHMELDMRTAEIEEAGPEYPIATAVGAQLSRKYGIPSYSCPASDSKIADLQAGFEMAETLHTALLSGINVTVNAGTASRCSAASFELLVLHNEMLRNMGRVRRGMIVNDDTVALDVQIEVGFGGDFLTHPHTLRHIRRDEEFLHKDLFDSSGRRMTYQDPLDKAHERWKHILLDHEVAVTRSDIKAIDRVVAGFTPG